MEPILLEISNSKQKTKLVRVVINNRSFYRLYYYSLITNDSQSYLFIEIDDAWNCIRYLLPQWHLSQLTFCSEQIKPLIKNDFFTELIKDKPVHEHWLVVLIGYGIHWL